MAMQHYPGQRLSLKSQLCTVQYIGPVDGKSGEWLGVEWDDRTRGKHDGVHEGKKYFDCRSRSPASASFLRSIQSWDTHRTFMQALREKYVSNNESTVEAIYFSTKQAEEVGFDKFARRQAELRGIRVLVLDHMRISHRCDDLGLEGIANTCQEITELDLSRNFFESFREIYDICKQLPKLQNLILDGNRFGVDFLRDLPVDAFVGIKTLSLSDCLLDYETQIVPFLKRYGSSSQPTVLHTLTATHNEWRTVGPGQLPSTLRVLDLSDNEFTSLSDLAGVTASSVETLTLKNCLINTLGHESTLLLMFASVRELDVRHNAIDSWSFFDKLSSYFDALKHLRTTGNPLYADLKTHDGKPLTAEDGYMLTIARLPKLETLNYSKITDKERLNAETYYLGLVAVEIAAAATDAEAADVRRRHPRYSDLCEKYGEPAAVRRVAAIVGDIDPNSLAARLVQVTFTVSSPAARDGPKWWAEDVPRSLSVYELMGIVGGKMNVMPLRLRLVLETDEKDPAGKEVGYEGPTWWCSDEEDGTDEDGEHMGMEVGKGTDWVGREVEMVAGTRALGTYVEGTQAKIRVEAVAAL